MEHYLLRASPAYIPHASVAAIGQGDRKRRKRLCTDRISPVVNSKVNTLEREREEVYLHHTELR